MTDPARRSFLMRTGAVGLGALIAGIGGRSLLDRSRTAPISEADLPPAAEVVPPLAAGADLAPTIAGPDPDRHAERSLLSDRYGPARPERRYRHVEPADPRARGARDDADVGRAAGPPDVRAVRDDRLRQQRGRRQPGRERQVDRCPAARGARHRRGLVVGQPARRPVRRRLHGRHADGLGHGPGSRADDRGPDERRAAAAGARLSGAAHRARACTATCRRRSGWPSWS